MTSLRTTIGLDIGGTKISGGVIDGKGTMLAQARRDTPALDPAAIIREAADLTRELSAEHKIDAVGVACAAFIDRSGSTIYFSPNQIGRAASSEERRVG